MRIDLDIEGGAILDQASINRRNQALDPTALIDRLQLSYFEGDANGGPHDTRVRIQGGGEGVAAPLMTDFRISG